MKEVNAAYAAGDEDALRRILAGLAAVPMQFKVQAPARTWFAFSGS